ncbi:hypothetical protein Q4512_10050 [Oceanihabitans sp. 2_MG-2023]|uniref:hypothetical protein n=1 Tax=Oceanihabitans sp. 2_MG-2023 TaxID=3062661 RepID=UPI0026E248BD|nr:hypothetical protein [Oceanihabitans sp. 2_MG-2023]MDO6597255.1 hypothetical protein [Oceanihabitans sp. 2_MG-2023]
MKNILNYKLTHHFEERLNQRQIDPFLVSMCLVKGDIKMMKKNKIEFTLSKDAIKQAIAQGYMLARDCLGITSLTVVVRKNILITTFAKFGDTGISN